MRYNQGDHQFTESEMFFRILRMVPHLCWNRIRYGRWLDILITHAPPRGIHDKEDTCHTGFKAFLWFMRCFKPAYLLHGHVHLIDMNEQRVGNVSEHRGDQYLLQLPVGVEVKRMENSFVSHEEFNKARAKGTHAATAVDVAMEKTTELLSFYEGDQIIGAESGDLPGDHADTGGSHYWERRTLS